VNIVVQNMAFRGKATSEDAGKQQGFRRAVEIAGASAAAILVPAAAGLAVFGVASRVSDISPASHNRPAIVTTVNSTKTSNIKVVEHIDKRELLIKIERNRQPRS
jgi:hypothetical protein